MDSYCSPMEFSCTYYLKIVGVSINEVRGGLTIDVGITVSNSHDLLSSQSSRILGYI